MTPVLLAVDGTGLLVRCSRAAAARSSPAGMATSAGEPTATLTILAGALAKLTRFASFSHALVAWDGPGALGWRREIWPGYKAGQGEFDLSRGEAAQAAGLCEAARISQWSARGFEADDLLACAARSAETIPGMTSVLASDDADILQLASPRAVVLRSGLAWTASNVEEFTGIPPERMAMLRALSGDPSDGIPGIFGIGRSRALKMLEDAGWAWPLPQSVLPDASVREQVSAWRSIMDLRDPPRRPESYMTGDELNVANCAWSPPDHARMLPFFQKYEMRSLEERSRKGHLW